MVDQEKIHNQCLSNNPSERVEALDQLRSFSLLPDKQKSWDDLIKLTSDKENWIRARAASTLSFVFSYAPDKMKAWNELHRLTNDEDSEVRSGAVYSFSFIFSDVPDKQQAWSDLIKLIKDEDRDVRYNAVRALSSAASQIPDKQQVWGDLHKLTTDQDEYVRCKVASALGFVFSQVPDKYHAWKDLNKLSNDSDSRVKTYASYSLGRVSIFDASQTENEKDYRRELEKAIEFFERASQESRWLLGEQDNPSQFCLPFYQSFHDIIFNRQETNEEVDRYLAEAKSAIKGSKSKEMLFEIVEIANALKEITNLGTLNLEAKKSELNIYKQYCERVEECMRDTEKIAPFAAKTLIKGLPIIDKNIKLILEEIQEKAKTACKESKGTATEEIAYAVNREVQKWEIGSQEYLKMQIDSLVDLLKFYIPKTQENSSITNKVDIILQESDIVIQYILLNNLIPQIIGIQLSRKTESILKEIQELRYSVNKIVTSIDELHNPQEYLAMIQRDLEEIKDNIPEMKGKIDEVLYELYSPLSTTQKLKVAIPLIPLLVSYEIETDVPKLAADKINELKNLILRKM